MNTSKLLACVVLAVVLVSGASACPPCGSNYTCNTPRGCELGRRICACCDECRAPEGGVCGPLTAGCESHLVCLTKDGVFSGHPPTHLRADGKCVRPKDIEINVIQPRIGRSVPRLRKAARASASESK